MLVGEMPVSDYKLVYHNGNTKYEFMAIRNAKGAWGCWNVVGEDMKMCWQNKLYGLPCSHILSMWCRLILNEEKTFNFDDVQASTHRMYRRATYTAGGNISHRFARRVLARGIW